MVGNGEAGWGRGEGKEAAGRKQEEEEKKGRDQSRLARELVACVRVV